jgi:hypothetical protein
MPIEILTEDEFKHYKSFRDCYFVITDTTRRTIHTAGCSDVNISGFSGKGAGQYEQKWAVLLYT